MINKAMFYDKNQLNEFTLLIKVINEETKTSAFVKARNGMIFEVFFRPANKSKDEEAIFYTSDWGYVWWLDGSSVKNSDFDLCYIEDINNPQIYK